MLGVRCFGNVFCPLFFMRSYVFAKNSKFFFLERVTKHTVRSSSFAQSFRNLFSQHIYPKCLLSHNSAQKRRIKEVTHFKGMIGSSLWLGYWREQTLFRSIKRHHKIHKSSTFSKIFFLNIDCFLPFYSEKCGSYLLWM